MSLNHMQIQSHSHPYSATEFESVRAAFESLDSATKTFFLVDQRVAELYRSQLESVTTPERLFTIEASEVAKSYEQLEPVFCWLLSSGCQRSSQLIVVGGGVLQDIGCFIASVLLRGVRWTLLPTTLLAQCDSCIGSKSSLNISRFKNQLGTFYPPHEVRLAPEFLNTLTQQEVFSGLGEAIKLHLIDGESSVGWLREQIGAAGAEKSLPLREIVWRSLEIKKRFIEEDEFDRGIRNLLNYGHTFAHALESATQYAVPHGIAVAIGIVCATYFSERLEMVPAGYCAELAAWLRPYFAEQVHRLRGVDPAALFAAMKQDKKNVGQQITFILTRGAGRMEKSPLDIAVAQDLLQDCLTADIWRG